jgi:hypothetical protein
MEGVWEKGFWVRSDYRQRIRAKQWTEVLLNGDDTIIRKGKIRQMVAKNLGYGVVEISLKPLAE